MSMIKRGTCINKVAISETVYSCPECGHKDVGVKICPECGATMESLSKSKKRSGSKDKRD